MPFQTGWNLQTDAIIALVAVLAGVAVVAVAVLVHVGPFAAAAPVAGQTGVVVGAVFVVVTLEALRAVGAREVTPVAAAALLADSAVFVVVFFGESLQLLTDSQLLPHVCYDVVLPEVFVEILTLVATVHQDQSISPKRRKHSTLSSLRYIPTIDI